jgi:type II secretory pathway component PulF
MAVFKYQAVDNLGKELNEQVEAESEAAAMKTLHARNLTVLEMRPAGAGDVAAAADVKPAASGKGQPRVPVAVVLGFYEQLGFLIKAGIPVFLAIKMLGETLSNPALSLILKSVLFELSEGFPLSGALQKFPDSFPPLHTSLIGVGEKSGNLDGALAQLVELTREQQEIREKIVKAAAYPIFLLVLSGSLVVGLLLFIFPKFEEIFLAFDVKLPWTTEN